MKPETLWQRASEVAEHSQVSVKIAELKAAAQSQFIERQTESGIWSVERAFSEVETNLSLARDEKQLSAANKATEQALKLSGLLADKPREGEVSIHKVTVILPESRRNPEHEAIEGSYTMLDGDSLEPEDGSE